MYFVVFYLNRVVGTMLKFKCSICGYIYDELVGIPERGIMSQTKWETLLDSFVCPICGALKSAFKRYEENPVDLAPSLVNVNDERHVENFEEMSAGEISVICSSLAKGCEKQHLTVEMEAFNKLADYFKSKTTIKQAKTLNNVTNMLDNDINRDFVSAKTAAQVNMDRGALRSLVWSEKVSTIMKMLLDRFVKEGETMFENTKMWVCDICGFIYIGDISPEICPICKVPNFKIIEVERS